MHKIPIKPLSVNAVWRGQRFKTPAYTKYEKDCFKILPKIDIPEGELSLYLEFGQSNSRADIDNGIKPVLDIFCKAYGFDDCRIVEMSVRKKKVEKGAEYVLFNIVSAEA